MGVNHFWTRLDNLGPPINERVLVVGGHSGGIALVTVNDRCGRVLLKRPDLKTVYEEVNHFGLAYAVIGSSLFYLADKSTISRIDLPSGKQEVIYSLTKPGLWIFGPLDLSDDGMIISFNMVNEIGDTSIAVWNRSNGVFKSRQSPFLEDKNPAVTHAQVHPTDSCRLMFSHERSWVMDRLWEWYFCSDQIFPFIANPPVTEWGHESWFNGELKLVVQYGAPTRLIPSQLLLFDGDRVVSTELITRDIYFSHASGNGREFIAVDTYKKKHDASDWVVIARLQKGDYRLIEKLSWTRHPLHGHPTWNPSGTVVSFNNVYNSLGCYEELAVEQLDSLSESSCFSFD